MSRLRTLLMGNENRIGRRLTVWIIAFSSLVTLCISVVQLALEYRELRQNVVSNLEGVSVYVPSIADSLWNFDDKQLQLALAALVRLAGVHRASIQTPNQDWQWFAGEHSPAASLVRTFPLLHRAGDVETQIGTLEVAASLDVIYRQVAAHGLTIILSNGVKTFLVAFFMVALIRRLVTRRLETLAHEVKKLLPATLPGSGQSVTCLEPGGLDEIDEVARVIDATREDLRAAVADLQHLNEQLSQRERQQRTYLDTLSLLEEVVLDLDANGRIVSASPGWQSLVGDSGDAEGLLLAERFSRPDDIRAIADTIEQFHRGKRDSAFLRLHLKRGPERERWVECRLLPTCGEQGELTGICGVLHDVTRAHDYEVRIAHMALHDALTGLPNRSLLEDRIKIALRMAQRGQRKVAVCFIGLDHFKNINDSLGHRMGDQLLVAFASRVQAQLREGDTLARWGGDEFVILLPQLEGAADAREVAQQIEESLRIPLTIAGDEQRITFTMGISLYPDDADDADSLLAHAKRATYHAKTQGRNQTVWFTELAAQENPNSLIRMQSKLIQAVADHRIQAWYEPVVRANARDCNLAEVLARWHDDELGWTSPAIFIPIAENAGVIRELGHQVWLHALSALAEWRAQGQSLRLAVNLSKRQLFSTRFTEQLLGDLASRGLCAADIVLEITESVALLDVANASERLQDLHRSGFQLALDDFGTGYASLSQLHEMPVDELKIDISFVRRIHEPAGASMTLAIIQMAKALGLQTVAEGVEDEATAARLEAMGADYLQGFHFARPMPHHEFTAWLQQHALA